MPNAIKERNGENGAETETANGGDEPPTIYTYGSVDTYAAGDATPPTAQPLVLNDAYYELTGVNLRCLVKHIELVPENKLQTATTLCSEVDYVGVTKWHQRVTFYQSYDAGATYQTLNAAYQAWVTSQQPAQFKARPHSSQVASATNPVISGLVIPMPFDLMIGDAGVLSEVAIDWNMTAPPTVDMGSVAATGATAGVPGYFTPLGCLTPANLAALSGVTASPVTNWTTGQYVITADKIGANWNGTAWVAGVHP
jgi:hypothetical protein